MTFKVISKTALEVSLVSAENNKSAKLDIPATVTYKNKSYKVVAVDKNALKDCDELLCELSFPETVRSIGSYLFVSTSVNMGKSLLSAYTFGLAANPYKHESKIAGKELTLSISENTKEISPNAFIVSMDIRNQADTQMLQANIKSLPTFLTSANAATFGISPASVEVFRGGSAVAGHGAVNGTTPMSAAQQLPALTMNSDVDVDLPQASSKNANTFAVIIANEDYQKESKVDFARNDGQMFATYCKQVLGLPEKNVHLSENATLNNIIFEIDWLKKVCEAYSGEANVIIYYAGHGVPDEADGTAYLLPIDGMGQNPRTCYKLSEFYKTLGEMPTRNLTIFMDACFSGAKRSGDMLASARGVAIKAKAAAPEGNMVVLSAAQGDETAYSYKENGHGLFTYFLLKKLKETKGNVTLGELGDYVKQQVSRISIVENGKSQTPSVISSGRLGDQWRSMKLK